MREIKFRAWVKKREAMAFVSVMYLDKLKYHAAVELNYPFNRKIEKTREIVNLSEVELMQFTGLKDRKGREIYEGDIVKRYHRITDDEFLCEVVYRQSCCQFVLRVVETCIDVGKNEIFELSQSVARNCKVVGNIHENKELLK